MFMQMKDTDLLFFSVSDPLSFEDYTYIDKVRLKKHLLKTSSK